MSFSLRILRVHFIDLIDIGVATSIEPVHSVLLSLEEDSSHETYGLDVGSSHVPGHDSLPFLPCDEPTLLEDDILAIVLVLMVVLGGPDCCVGHGTEETAYLCGEGDFLWVFHST